MKVMEKLAICFLVLSASNAFADVVTFPRDVICGKVMTYEFKSSSKLGVSRKVVFSSANIITFSSYDDSQSKVASSLDELVQLSSAQDTSSENILINSVNDLSIAKALNQTVCLDKHSITSGPETLFPMGRANDEGAALSQILSIWD